MIENEDTEVSGSAEPISSIIDVTDHEETVNDVGIQDDTETKIDPSLSSTSIHEPRSIVSDSSLLASDNKLCDGASQTTTRGDLGEETLHASQPPSQARVSRRKHRRAEGLTSDEGDSDGDEDFTGEEIKKSSRKKRKVSLCLHVYCPSAATKEVILESGIMGTSLTYLCTVHLSVSCGFR